MKKILLAAFLFVNIYTNAQFSMPSRDDSWKKKYRAFSTKVTDLVHTKLQAKFNYEKSQLIGKVWLTLKPHFYPTSTVELDAKGMEINKVELVKGTTKVALVYDYSSKNILKINLDREYKNKESYTIFIDYIAKPDELVTQGSAAIKDAKGLYFINPKGEEKDKPTQIWTQGETEATSVWVPTIDKPNQKSTQDFYLTVPSKYVTLSNGKLASQIKNSDGTRTDNWKMDLPHAPYLFFMGVGDFAVVKDSYKGKEVSYYVEKEYEKVARKIFGNTPEMMKFFSTTVTGVDYPWAKYSQIVGRDYVSGAMENTTATLHMDRAQQNARELQDENGWETTIAHELFHHWFGDYVTAESWSNLTVNESFADYSEYLWMEYKYGKDAAGEENDNAMKAYLRSNSSKKDLVRFFYADKEDMFDLVSYQKGGRILNMLRSYVGDSAFFKSLNKYLTDNKFGNGSAHKLRLAFESVTGKDLNWYFNQWYFNNGHPKLDINYSYDDVNKKAIVIINQTQDSNKIFKIPSNIDIYIGNTKTRKDIWIENRTDTFSFAVNEQPSAINFDGDKFVLADRKENKSLENYAVLYKNGCYVDRKEAIEFAAKNKNQATAMSILKEALHDKYFNLRRRVLNILSDTTVDASTIAVIENIAKSDEKKLVRASAIDYLSSLKNKKYESMFTAAAKDSSYSVAGSALEALAKINPTAAMQLLPDLKKDMKGSLKDAVSKVEIMSKGDNDFEEVSKKFDALGPMEKFNEFENYSYFLTRLNNTENFKKAVDELVSYRNMVAPFGQGLKEMLNKKLAEVVKEKKAQPSTASNDEQIKYLEEKIKD